MKKLLTITLAVLIFAAAHSWAQDDKPPIDLSVYPGGSAVMEINMTAEELMSAVEAMMPLMTERFGASGQAFSSAELADVVRDVRRIEYLQVEVPKASITPQQIADFYSKKLPHGEWTRVFWAKDDKGSIAVFTQANTEQIYGFRISSTKQDAKIIRRAQVFKLEGKIDYVKALKLFAKAGVKLMSQS